MNCHLITPRARQWLADACAESGRSVRCRSSRSARILHLFDEVCNLVDSQGNVLSLVTSSIGPGPFTLMVDDGFTAVLDINQPVRIEDGQLTIGPLRLDTRQATLWQPRPFWSRLCEHDDWPASPKIAPLSSEMEVYLRQLLLGIQTVDEQQIRAGAAALAGRGPGLTPLGDDVLLGVLYGMWVWQPRREWMRMIVATAAPLTTTLSAAFLRAAAAGEAVWQWHDLVNGRTDAIEHILAIGHTSGAAALTGFIYTWEMISPRTQPAPTGGNDRARCIG